MRAVLEKDSVVGKTAPEPVWKSATGFARTEQTTGPPDLPAFPHHWLIPAVWCSHKAINYTLWYREQSLSDTT